MEALFNRHLKTTLYPNPDMVFKLKNFVKKDFDSLIRRSDAYELFDVI